MLCTGLFPNADTKIQHRRRPTCPLWYDKYQLCSIWLNYVYFCTQAYAADYPSGSISLPKWLSQITQVAQSANPAVCVSESSRLRNPVQPYPYPSSATSVGKRKYIVCLPHLSAQLLLGQISLSEDTTRANNSYHQGQLCVF